MFALEPEGNVLRWCRVGGPYIGPEGFTQLGGGGKSERQVGGSGFLEDLVVGTDQIGRPK